MNTARAPFVIIEAKFLRFLTKSAFGILLTDVLPIFDHKVKNEEKMLRITIPESLDYTDVFKNTFEKYTKVALPIGVKTTGMGSMFRLSFKIIMKDQNEEKAFIDELRTLNGNLEIQILPLEEKTNVL